MLTQRFKTQLGLVIAAFLAAITPSFATCPYPPVTFPLTININDDCPQLSITAGSTGTIINSGHITNLDPAGIGVGNDGNITNFTNNSTGVINGHLYSVRNDQSGFMTLINNGTIGANGAINAIYNNTNPGIGRFVSATNNVGGIISGSDYGVWNDISGTFDNLSNSGTIAGSSIAGIWNARSGNFGAITSSGIITSNNVGILNSVDGIINTITNLNGGIVTGTNEAILNTSGTINNIVNSGSILSTQTAIENKSGGVITNITNNNGGIIQGSDGNGIAIYNWGLGTISAINNSGLISGHAGIGNAGNVDSLINSGTINVGQGAVDNSGTINSIFNSGNIHAYTAGVAVMAIWNNTDSTITNITNSSGGTISGYYAIENRGTITTLTNVAGATINSVHANGIGIYNECGTINSLVNSGTIANGIYNSYLGFGGNPPPIAYLYGQINSLTNNVGGIITNAGNTIYNADQSTISNLVNNGIINSSEANGIQNLGTINSINNTGTISGAGYSINNLGKITTGITNSGTISSLNNKQGNWNGGALSYTGSVPGSYYTFISSTNNYGQITFTNPTGTMNFNIASGSTVQKGTYTNIMRGVSSSNISNKSGVFDGLSWKLTQNSAGDWDLIFGYLGVSISNTLAGMANNQQSIYSFLHQRYAVMAVVLNYECANFDKYGVCISFQSRATGFGNQSTGAGVLTASHKITDKIHIGAFLDYQVNQVTPGISSLGPGGVQSGYNNATFGGFAGYNENSDRTGLQAKISGAYNPGKVTVTRPLLENTEAGIGTAGLIGSGVYGEIGWGFGFAKTFVATPFVGIRGIDITRNGYSESYNAAVQFPISYNSYYERVLTGIAGGQIKAAITDRLNFQAGVWAELDVRRSANTYSGWSTIPGLETFALAHGGSQNRLRPAGYVGVSYDVAKNQRITANTLVREQAYSNRTNVTGLIGYQISF